MLVLAFMMFVGGAAAQTSENTPKRMLQSCGSGCSYCSSGICYQCMTGYYMNSYYCSSCPYACYSCSSWSNCTSCNSGYSMSYGSCNYNGNTVPGIVFGVFFGVFLLVCVCVCVCRKLAQRRTVNLTTNYNGFNTGPANPVLVVSNQPPQYAPPTFQPNPGFYQQQHQYQGGYAAPQPQAGYPGYPQHGYPTSG